MNYIRNAFLGSAALLVAATGAQAADMMMEVKAPREPVYRCDITGFIELPGTDICFKVGGFARLVVVGAQDNWFGDAFYRPDHIIPDGHTLIDRLQMYGQGRVNFDARTSTEYGTVRAFVELQATDDDTRTGGAANLRHAFVQFGNWTFGKTWSTFLHLDSSATTTDPYVIIGDNFMRRNQIRYTQSFGNGFSVSVAVEDQEYTTPISVNAGGAGLLYIGPPGGPTLYPAGPLIPSLSAVNDRNSMPDIVANIRVDGDWGNAQLSGAIHNNQFRNVTVGFPPQAAPVQGNQTDSEIGWAALFGLVINTPSIGDGDFFSFKAIYTDGAHQYFQDSFGGAGIGGGGVVNTIWGQCTPGAPALGNCIVDTVTTWSVLAGFTHNWTPTFNSTLGGGYGSVDVPKVLTTYGPAVPFALGTTGTADLDTKFWQVYLDFAWTPVPRTTFQVDLVYGNADYNYPQWNGANNCVGPVAVCGPLGSDDDGAFSAAFQVTRSF
ncbi:porin [Microbaculum marinum]|uniref:Porin n=1 Tax=Microbaculum marinum TaxID=1764581 RepID=A0AAW9RTA1_9HYPH